MRKPLPLKHSFVEFIPADLEPEHLYISIPYATAVHLCPCGCGNKVVTPISPPEWHLTYDGDTVSLNPSVGNWQFPCKSHYYIRHSSIKWEAVWTDAQIAVGRERDGGDVDRYFRDRLIAEQGGSAMSLDGDDPPRPHGIRRLFRRLRLSGRF